MSSHILFSPSKSDLPPVVVHHRQGGCWGGVGMRIVLRLDANDYHLLTSI
jgi:hypothetical protein